MLNRFLNQSILIFLQARGLGIILFVLPLPIRKKLTISACEVTQCGAVCGKDPFLDWPKNTYQDNDQYLQFDSDSKVAHCSSKHFHFFFAQRSLDPWKLSTDRHWVLPSSLGSEPCWVYLQTESKRTKLATYHWAVDPRVRRRGWYRVSREHNIYYRWGEFFQLFSIMSWARLKRI